MPHERFLLGVGVVFNLLTFMPNEPLLLGVGGLQIVDSRASVQRTRSTLANHSAVSRRTNVK